MLCPFIHASPFPIPVKSNATGLLPEGAPNVVYHHRGDKILLHSFIRERERVPGGFFGGGDGGDGLGSKLYLVPHQWLILRQTRL